MKCVERADIHTEWSKHGTCSKMSQHAYFSKALSLVKQYRGSCESGSSCDICFTQVTLTLCVCVICAHYRLHVGPFKPD